ncbi:MAG: peptide deformylase [Candidatus Omnitrophica bacterium]|nr:peptide deformylase [Candidatus Omnitrophota bacterium]MBU1932382.1 peptide deformylase [Candidatus Omnitrophota bacterium]
MAKLAIRIYPDRVLRKKSSTVKSVGEEERRLASDMVKTMRSANGVGLAAPQVGVSRRIIVVDDLENSSSALVLINPVIIKKKGRSRFCEGCLSVPNITSDILRPESIIVEALNLDGDKIKIGTGGFLARVIQHETDHLDGILFIDRIVFLKRRKIFKKISSKVCMEL